MGPCKGCKWCHMVPLVPLVPLAAVEKVGGSTRTPCPTRQDVRPTRGNASTAPKLTWGGWFSHGYPCYLRCPTSCSFSLGRSCFKFVFISVTSMDRPTRPKSGTVADRPTFRNTYPRTDRPDGSPLARDRYPSLGNTFGRLSLAQGCPHRPYMRTRTYTR